LGNEADADIEVLIEKFGRQEHVIKSQRISVSGLDIRRHAQLYGKLEEKQTCVEEMPFFDRRAQQKRTYTWTGWHLRDGNMP
jgi:hypothetical protein